MTRVAFIDLTRNITRIEPVDPAITDLFIGGRGYGSKILSDRVGPEIDPLSPDNLLIFSIGPFCGTPWPESCRVHVTFKSPLTGIYGHSNSGGQFGAELAKAGYDALVISGKAKSPVYLYISGESIEIRPADDMWGYEVSKVNDRLDTLGKVACIGPAGERLVKFSAIINDRHRAAARAGGGAVMGSKLLKAIVVKANQRKTLPESFRRLAIEVNKGIASKARLNDLRRYGTSILVDYQNISGALPSRNHQSVQVPYLSKVKASRLDQYVTDHTGCFSCSVRCTRESVIPEGIYATQTSGPEYETIAALGPMTWLSDMEAVIYANQRCNDLGLDTISTGVVIAFAMECHERGLLSDGQMSLEWGDPICVIGLIERIASRQGVGDLLAEGTRGAAIRLGGKAIDYAMQVKGLELPRQDPRVAKGFGLGHAVGNRGADHLYALPTIDLAGLWDVARKYFPEETLEELMDPADEQYKPDLVVLGEHFCAVVDSLGVCKLVTAENHVVGLDDLARGLSALWERQIGVEDLLLFGERIVNLERLFNIRHGMDRADDSLPSRFSAEPVDIYEYTQEPTTGLDQISEEPIKSGAIVQDLDAMLDRYYDLRGWSRDGKPSLQTLKRLTLA